MQLQTVLVATEGDKTLGMFHTSSHAAAGSTGSLKRSAEPGLDAFLPKSAAIIQNCRKISENPWSWSETLSNPLFGLVICSDPPVWGPARNARNARNSHGYLLGIRVGCSKFDPSARNSFLILTLYLLGIRSFARNSGWLLGMGPLRSERSERSVRFNLTLSSLVSLGFSGKRWKTLRICVCKGFQITLAFVAVCGESCHSHDSVM